MARMIHLEGVYASRVAANQTLYGKLAPFSLLGGFVEGAWKLDG